MFKNYYDILGVAPGATPTKLKSAYRTLARKYHPDSGTEGGSDILFNEVTEAYHVLSDPEQREKYDRRHGFDQLKEEQNASVDSQPEEASDTKQADSNNTSEAEQTQSRNEQEQDSFYHGGPRVKAKESIRTDDLDPQGYAGPSGNRFSHTSRGPGFLDRMRELFGAEEKQPKMQSSARSSASFKPPPPRQRQSPRKTKRTVEDALRGDREFTFTISATESLGVSFRQIAVKDGVSPRTIRVKIPAGVCDGATLKVKLEDGDFVRVHVRVQSDELLSREGYDIVLKLPITVGESINGGELEVPTPLGPVTVKLPAQSKERKRLRLKGRGALKPGSSGARGDLFVKPYVVAPDINNEVVRQAASAIDEHYLGSVRAQIPKKL